MKYLTLRDVYNDIIDLIVPSQGGLIGAIYNSTLLTSDFTELKTFLTNYSLIDDEYRSHSYDKYISPYTILRIDKDDAYNSPLIFTSNLANALIVKYAKNWNDIIKAFNEEYKPLENYSMVEHEEYNSKITSDSESQGNRFGFNTTSDDGVPDTKANASNTTSGEAKDNYKDLTRSGNIGVTTSQQMLQSELEVRKYNILDMLYKDIDKLLCLKVY